jgi:flagellar biosynthesis/type III secretory pathway M-ring protein FliF/YscJ
MLKRLLAALLPTAPAARGRTPAKTLAQLEAEIEAELDAEAAAAVPEAERRALILRRIQEAVGSDPEALAPLIRAWMREDRS